MPPKSRPMTISLVNLPLSKKLSTIACQGLIMSGFQCWLLEWSKVLPVLKSGKQWQIIPMITSSKKYIKINLADVEPQAIKPLSMMLNQPTTHNIGYDMLTILLVVTTVLLALSGIAINYLTYVVKEQRNVLTQLYTEREELYAWKADAMDYHLDRDWETIPL